MSDEEIKKMKEEIDSLSHYDMCHIWRFSDSENKMLQGEVGKYFSDRLFNHFGGFNPKISEKLGW